MRPRSLISLLRDRTKNSSPTRHVPRSHEPTLASSLPAHTRRTPEQGPSKTPRAEPQDHHKGSSHPTLPRHGHSPPGLVRRLAQHDPERPAQHFEPLKAGAVSQLGIKRQERLGLRPHPRSYEMCIAAPWRPEPPRDSPILTASS